MSRLNWETVRICDLGEVVGGGTPKTSIDEYYNGDIAWITPKDLSNYDNVYISRGARNISKNGLANSSARLLPEGTVLFSSRAPIGYVAIAEVELSTNQGFKSIIPNENTDSKYLYYLMKYYADEIEAKSSGTTFKEVSGGTLKQIEVFAPLQKTTQERISSILYALDKKIELNRKINHHLVA